MGIGSVWKDSKKRVFLVSSVPFVLHTKQSRFPAEKIWILDSGKHWARYSAVEKEKNEQFGCTSRRVFRKTLILRSPVNGAGPLAYQKAVGIDSKEICLISSE